MTNLKIGLRVILYSGLMVIGSPIVIGSLIMSFIRLWMNNRTYKLWNNKELLEMVQDRIRLGLKNDMYFVKYGIM